MRVFNWAKALCATAMAASSIATAVTATAADVGVQISAGRIFGSLEGNLQVYRGIPYAKPPIGALRWAPTEPAAPWAGVRDAKEYGASCVQKVAAQEPERSLEDKPQSEDCLTLNVWAPTKHIDNPRLPVMVWVHGGSFRYGTGSLDLYRGDELAKRQAVVITLNYRLGLFGTFAHPDLLKSQEPSGNYGLLDVIQALRWTKANASAFGGDPDNVTLFGESAGGATIAYLMTSPLARGLFSKAIVESGALSLPELDPAKAGAVADRVTSELGATNVADLRSLPAEKIRDAETSAGDTMPFIDGRILKEGMRASFEAGHAMKVPLLIGSNDFEAGFFGAAAWKSTPAKFGKSWPSIRPLCFGYGQATDDACASQVYSEQFAGVVTRAVERAQSRFAPVFAYRFEWVPPSERSLTPGAIHTAEIPYVFGHAALEAGDTVSRALSKKLADGWVSFARDGTPHQPYSDWKPFGTGAGEQVFLIGNNGSSMARNPADELLDGLDRLNPKVR